METVCIKVKLKPNSLMDVHKWFDEIQNRQTEVIETFLKEDVFVESAFLDQQGEDFFLIYYMKAKNIQKAVEIFQKSTLDLDIYHKKQWDKYCQEIVELKTLFDVDRIQEKE